MKDSTLAVLLRTGALAGLLAATVAAAAHGRPHDLIDLDIGVDADRVTFQVDSPLDSLLGFGHAPVSAIERNAAATLLKRMQGADWLVRIDPRAECALAHAELAAPVLNRPAPRSDAASAEIAEPAAGNHGSLIASYEFECRHMAALDFVQVSVFDEFKRVHRIAVRVAGAGAQFAVMLDRGSGAAKVRLKR
jgi:hypothetical protein